MFLKFQSPKLHFYTRYLMIRAALSKDVTFHNYHVDKKHHWQIIRAEREVPVWKHDTGKFLPWYVRDYAIFHLHELFNVVMKYMYSFNLPLHPNQTRMYSLFHVKSTKIDLFNVASKPSTFPGCFTSGVVKYSPYGDSVFCCVNLSHLCM